MFAYCGNNPACRADTAGFFWDTVLDFTYLCFSIADVIENPNNPEAWLNAAADTASLLVPCVSAGLLTRVATKADDVVDTLRAVDNLGDVKKTTVVWLPEKFNSFQIKASDAVDAWDDFLGPNQTSYNRYKEVIDPDRIFSADGTKSIRFSGHEMDSIGTNKAHFHYEIWNFDPNTNTVFYERIGQRLK